MPRYRREMRWSMSIGIDSETRKSFRWGGQGATNISWIKLSLSGGGIDQELGVEFWILLSIHEFFLSSFVLILWGRSCPHTTSSDCSHQGKHVEQDRDCAHTFSKILYLRFHLEQDRDCCSTAVALANYYCDKIRQ